MVLRQTSWKNQQVTSSALLIYLKFRCPLKQHRNPTIVIITEPYLFNEGRRCPRRANGKISPAVGIEITIAVYYLNFRF